MAYILFAIFIFYLVFISTPREGLVFALILFAINILKIIRIVGECDGCHKAKIKFQKEKEKST